MPKVPPPNPPPNPFCHIKTKTITKCFGCLIPAANATITEGWAILKGIAWLWNKGIRKRRERESFDEEMKGCCLELEARDSERFWPETTAVVEFGYLTEKQSRLAAASASGFFPTRSLSAMRRLDLPSRSTEAQHNGQFKA
nr:hypothetical protein Iba_chr08fCG3100 [Ipomoea batatas]